VVAGPRIAPGVVGSLPDPLVDHGAHSSHLGTGERKERPLQHPYQPDQEDRTRVRVHVDEERCQGHGRCYATAPEVFIPDELGNGREAGDGTVPEELEGKTRLAVANCPEQAISIEETI